jgi:uncharacterized protein YjbJ (UPF0337 family)
MNTDVLQGKWTQLKGTVRKQWGKLTDDDVDQIKATQRSCRAGSRSATGARRSRQGGSRQVAAEPLKEATMRATQRMTLLAGAAALAATLGCGRHEATSAADREVAQRIRQSLVADQTCRPARRT